MLYVVNTPAIYGNDDKIYPITGCLSYPKLEDLEALVELWSQYYACLNSEWNNGVYGALPDHSEGVRWNFWNSDFHQERGFLDFDRVRTLCYNNGSPHGLPFQKNYNHIGALYIGSDPLASYNTQHDWIYNFTGGQSAQIISDHFGSNMFYNESGDTTPPYRGIIDTFGTHPFWVNQFALKKDIVQMFQNIQPIANDYLYQLTPSQIMFSSGTQYGSGQYGQPFDMANHQESSHPYQRMKHYESQNGFTPDPQVADSVVMLGTSPNQYPAENYINDAFVVSIYWTQGTSTGYNDGTASDPSGYHHYEWTKEIQYLQKNVSDPYLWKNVPIPSRLWGENVEVSRQLLILWEIHHTINQTKAQSGQTTTDKYYYVVSKHDYLKGSDIQFSDIYGNSWGLCQQWRFEWQNFNDVINWVEQEAPEATGFNPAWTPPDSQWIYPDDQSVRWGDPYGTGGVYADSGDYLVWKGERLTITPKWFYSCQKSKLTQNVTYPQSQP